MSKKEKLHFSHGSGFESVDDLLNTAMEKLDEANARITRLLETASQDIDPEAAIAATTENEAAAPQADAEAAEVPRSEDGSQE